MIEKNRNPFLIYEIFSRSEFVLIVTNGAVGIFGLSGSFWDQSQILSSFWTAEIRHYFAIHMLHASLTNQENIIKGMKSQRNRYFGMRI